MHDMSTPPPHTQRCPYNLYLLTPLYNQAHLVPDGQFEDLNAVVFFLELLDAFPQRFRLNSRHGGQPVSVERAYLLSWNLKINLIPDIVLLLHREKLPTTGTRRNYSLAFYFHRGH